jgi:hypothetical protein
MNPSALLKFLRRHGGDVADKFSNLSDKQKNFLGAGGLVVGLPAFLALAAKSGSKHRENMEREMIMSGPLRKRRRPGESDYAWGESRGLSIDDPIEVLRAADWSK